MPGLSCTDSSWVQFWLIEWSVQVNWFIIYACYLFCGPGVSRGWTRWGVCTGGEDLWGNWCRYLLSSSSITTTTIVIPISYNHHYHGHFLSHHHPSFSHHHHYHPYHHHHHHHHYHQYFYVPHTSTMPMNTFFKFCIQQVHNGFLYISSLAIHLEFGGRGDNAYVRLPSPSHHPAPSHHPGHDCVI